MCDIEVRVGFMPTYALLRRLESDYPQHQFKLIIGSDLVKDLCNWDDSEQLLEHTRFAIVARPAYQAFPSALESDSSTSASRKKDTMAIDVSL